MFIYVMDIESRDILVKLGYELFKSSDERNIWVFKNKSEQCFDNLGVPCVVSDMLTF